MKVLSNHKTWTIVLYCTLLSMALLFLRYYAEIGGNHKTIQHMFINNTQILKPYVSMDTGIHYQQHMSHNHSSDNHTNKMIVYVESYNQDNSKNNENIKELPDTFVASEMMDTIPVTEQTEQIDESRKLNVLFIISDDLRPQLYSYKGPHFPDPNSHVNMVTPHLDKLANKSLLLTRAYVQYSLCAPSRTSFLTGRRPDTTKVWDLVTYWRQSAGDFTTLPQFFKDNGYVTAGAGKIFHGGKSAHHFDPQSWSVKYKRPKHGNYWNQNMVKDTWRAVSVDEHSSIPLPDEEITDQAISHLRRFATDSLNEDRNFFLGVGFHKPHLPFVFPSKFLDIYPLDEVELATNDFTAGEFPKEAYIPSTEILSCDDIKSLNYSGRVNDTLSRNVAISLRRAYFACVSYIDTLVGKLLKELDILGLSKSTLVSFIGDHGWHLGENGHWGKHTNFEQGTHAPMMLHIPGKTEHGIRSNSLVEFVDLFPTIVKAAGFKPIPPCPKDSSQTKLCTEGVSILPLINRSDAVIKHAAFSQMSRRDLMGYSMRTDQYRYTAWLPLTRTKQSNGLYHIQMDWRSSVNELYDHSTDPLENVNLINDVEYIQTASLIRDRLREQVGEYISNVKPNTT